MRKIAFYCRVSTQEQGKKQTIETQLAKLRETYKNEKVVKIYKDICSGAYLQRDGLNQLREDIKKSLFDTIAIYSLDRLSRKLGHQIALIEEFEKQAVKVEVLGENYEDSPEGMLNRNIRGAFAEYERYKIAKRMRDGKYRKVNEGKLVGCYPSFGYKLIKKTENKNSYFKIDPKEARIVRLIFGIYLEEQSIRQTAKRLLKMEINGRGRGKKKPTPLHPKTVGKMLRNESYIGNWYYGKTYACEPKYNIKKKRKHQLSGRKVNPKSEWKLVKIPSIIDKPSFDRTQEILEKRKKHYLQPTKYSYLCQGLIKCIHCGRTYFGKKHSSGHVQKRPNGDHFFYVCPQKFKTTPYEEQCRSRTMSIRKVDNVVWEYLYDLIMDTKRLKKAIRTSQEERENKRDFNQKVYDSLIGEKAKTKKDKSKLLDLYIDANVNKEDLDEKISELNNKETDLDKQIKEAGKDLEKLKQIGLIEKEAEEMCLRDQKTVANATLEQKKIMVRRWVKEINILDDGKVLIRVKLPELEKRPIKPQFIPQYNVVELDSPSL